MFKLYAHWPSILTESDQCSNSMLIGRPYSQNLSNVQILCSWTVHTHRLCAMYAISAHGPTIITDCLLNVSQSLQTNSGTELQIKTTQLLSTSFPIHYSLIIYKLDVVIDERLLPKKNVSSGPWQPMGSETFRREDTVYYLYVYRMSCCYGALTTG
jgi:hypothetical protein